MGSPAELLLDELRRKLDGQLSTLESVRTRTTVILSASAAVVGFFINRGIGHDNSWQQAALCLFVIGGVISGWIIAPHNLTLAPKGNDWIRYAKEHQVWKESQVDLDGATRQSLGDKGTETLAVAMAESMNTWYSDNAAVQKLVNLTFKFLMVIVLAQFVCWILSSTTR
jgi:hypothetical protein